MLSPSAHTDSFARENLPPASQWPVMKFDLPELRYPVRLNCGQRLLDDAIAEGFGAAPAILQGDVVLSYAGLKALTDRIAHVLTADLGVVPGGRVLLRGGNTPEMFAAWLAVMKAGAIAVTTMPMLRARELLPIIRKAQVPLALCQAGLEDALTGAQAEEPMLRRVISFGAPGAELERLASSKPDHFSAVQTAADDVCLIAFTSGTTGDPKATMHFHRDVMVMGDSFARHVVRAGPGAVFSGTPPIAFTFGLGGLLTFPLQARAAVALPQQSTPPALAEAIARHRVTHLFTSPTAYRAMLNRSDEHDLSSLTTCISAGEHLPVSTAEAWMAATGIRLIDGIGSTEMIHIFISDRPEDVRPGATGRPVPGYEACLLADDGQTIQGPGTGRLGVRGPTGCRYLNDARQTAYVVNGWNVTGDIFRRDEDGYYWYVARGDDMIVSSGYNIAGPEIEEALMLHPAVMECAVIGWPDSERGHIVKAVVVAREGFTTDDALAKALQDHIKATLAPYKYPRAVSFVSALPKTATGKLQRHALRFGA
jgi:2-aminobenzoate-CoA ligase